MRILSAVPLLFLSWHSAPAQGLMAVRHISSQRGPVAVHYDTSGPHAPFLRADADGNGHPDLADSIALYAQSFWDEYVTGMGLPAPAYDPRYYSAYPIALEDIPKTAGRTEFGYNQVDGYPNSFSVVENDFRQAGDSAIVYQPGASPAAYDKVVLYRNPYAILKGVVHHELMHGVQRRFATNAQLGKTWSEAVSVWCENRALYGRGSLIQAEEFSASLKSDMIGCAESHCLYGRDRLLAMLERMSGPAAVMEVFGRRARWVDSLGAGAIDNPAQELAYFRSILARAGIGWSDFLLRFSGELAHMFANSGSGRAAPPGGAFPVEKAFFNVGNGPGDEMFRALPAERDLGGLRLSIFSLASVLLKPGTVVEVACPRGACHTTAYHSMIDSLRFASAVIDAAHPLRLTLPPLGYIDLFVVTGEDSARIAFSQAPLSLAGASGRRGPRAFWSAGRIALAGLEPGRRARLSGWNLRGRLVMDAEVSGASGAGLIRPSGEGPLVLRLVEIP